MNFAEDRWNSSYSSRCCVACSSYTVDARGTLEWRKQMRPEAITWQDVEKLGHSGRIEVAAERDLIGRPIIFYQLKCAYLTMRFLYQA